MAFPAPKRGDDANELFVDWKPECYPRSYAVAGLEAVEIGAGGNGDDMGGIERKPLDQHVVDDEARRDNARRHAAVEPAIEWAARDRA